MSASPHRAAQLMDATRRLVRANHGLNVALRRSTRIPHAGIGTMIKVLARRGPTTLTELAERIDIDRSVASRYLTWLADEGHVERTVDPDDRRVRTITLTPSGEALHEDLQHELRRRVDLVVADWDAGTLERMTADMLLLADALDVAAEGGSTVGRPEGPADVGPDDLSSARPAASSPSPSRS